MGARSTPTMSELIGMYLAGNLQPAARRRAQVHARARAAEEVILAVQLHELERRARAVALLLRQVVELVCGFGTKERAAVVSVGVARGAVARGVTRSRRGRERQSPRRARDRRRDATSRERPRPRFITNASFRLFARRRARRRRIVSRESAPAAAVPRKRRMARGAGRGSATRAGDTHPGGVFLWLSCPSRSVNARRPRRDSRVRGRTVAARMPPPQRGSAAARPRRLPEKDRLKSPHE
jgi:hypothetical protein